MASILRDRNGELNWLGSCVRKAGIGRLVYNVYFRPVNWLRIKRLPDRPVELPLFGYTFAAPSPRSNPLSADLVRKGVWEPEVTETIKSVVKNGSCVVNVGADLGYYVLLASSLNPKGCVLAFEPNSLRQDFLCRNAAQAGGSVKVIRGALGNKNENVFLRTKVARVCMQGSSGEAGEWVPQFRFDDLPPEYDFPARPRISVVIIDVEGAEFDVLKGMECTLRDETPALLVEVHGPLLQHFGATKGELISWLKNLGYHAEWIAGDAISSGGYSHVLFRPMSANLGHSNTSD